MIRAMLPDEYAKPAQMEDGGILSHYEERVPNGARIPHAAGEAVTNFVSLNFMPWWIFIHPKYPESQYL